MRQAILCVAMSVLGAALCWGQEIGKKPESAKTKPVAALGWLVGGVWTADATKLGPGLQRIETRYQWSETNTFLRFNTHFISEKGIARTYDGNLFWSPEQKSLFMWYMNGDNEITEGPIRVEGDTWSLTFRSPGGDGKVVDFRVDVAQKTSDHYQWTLLRKQSDAWKELFSLEYLRVKGS
jgi:hypothetical protein